MGLRGPNGGWTDERVKLAIKLYLGGLSCSQVALEIRVRGEFEPSRSAIIGKMHRLNVRRPPSVEAAAKRLSGATLSAPRKPQTPSPAPASPRHLYINKGHVLFSTPDRSLPRLRQTPVQVEPKPWLERRFGECNWIVRGEGADAWACCAPVDRRGWCAAHCEIGLQKPKGWLSDASVRLTPKKRRAA